MSLLFTRIYISTMATDMRKGVDGLCGSVESEFRCDPMNGSLFVFFNRRRTMVKLLVWDRSGFWILLKRLESGTFSRWQGSVQEADFAQLLCILDGIELQGSYRRKRYSLQ